MKNNQNYLDERIQKAKALPQDSIDCVYISDCTHPYLDDLQGILNFKKRRGYWINDFVVMYMYYEDEKIDDTWVAFWDIFPDPELTEDSLRAFKDSLVAVGEKHSIRTRL